MTIREPSGSFCRMSHNLASCVVDTRTQVTSHKKLAHTRQTHGGMKKEGGSRRERHLLVVSDLMKLLCDGLIGLQLTARVPDVDVHRTVSAPSQISAV